MGRRRMSPQTARIVQLLAEHPAEWRHGYDLCRASGLKSGSLYPMLMRLTDQGLLEATWESQPPRGRPARHLYRLTGTGRQLARTLDGATSAHPPSSLRPAGLTDLSPITP